MTVEEMLAWLGIDSEMNEETSRRVQAWTPESKINVEELGHYLEVTDLSNRNV